MNLDLVLRKRLPDRHIFSGFRGTLLGSQSLSRLGIRSLLGLLDRTLRRLKLGLVRRDFIAKPLQILMQRRVRLLRLGRRHEGPWLELLIVPKTPLEPNPKLPRHPELVQRLRVIALPLMDRGVSDAAEIVKDRPLRRADHVALPEPIDELLEALLAAQEETHLGGGALCENFGELPELEERDRRVAGEVLLRLRTERD